MGVFLDFMGGNTSQPKLKKFREMKDYTSEQMRNWLMDNFKMGEIVELCGMLILDELNESDDRPITITQEEFERHFRIRKPQTNPHSLKSEKTLYNEGLDLK